MAGIGSGGTGIDPGGIGSGGTGVVATAGFGPVSGFGSIIVNGVRFETEGAQLLLEDVASLRLGVTVQVDGSLAPGGTEGVARTVRAAAELRGPVQSADPARRRWTVLGQQAFQLGHCPASSASISAKASFARRKLSTAAGMPP